MEFVKRQFWDDNEVVVQYYASTDCTEKLETNVLHLWRSIGHKLLAPPRRWL